MSQKEARESRAHEAIKMKDQQLQMLSQQNTHLLRSLDVVEEEAKNVQLEKLSVEEENRQLREQNFELQSKTQADANTIKALQVWTTITLKTSNSSNTSSALTMFWYTTPCQTKMADKDKQLKIMTDQNTELLRLLETEEAQTSKLNAENRAVREELDALRTKYSSLLASAKQHEELAAVAAREGQLRADELRLLRAEVHGKGR